MVTAYLSNWIMSERARVPKPTWREIADDVGCTHPLIIKLKNRQGNAGTKAETLFAKKLFGGSVDSLRAAARTFWEAHPELHTVAPVEAADANRDALAELLDAKGVDPDIVAQLRFHQAEPAWRMRDWVAWVEELQGASRITAHSAPRQLLAEEQQIPALKTVVKRYPKRWADDVVNDVRGIAAAGGGEWTEDDAARELDAAAARRAGKEVTRPASEEYGQPRAPKRRAKRA